MGYSVPKQRAFLAWQLADWRGPSRAGWHQMRSGMPADPAGGAIHDALRVHRHPSAAALLPLGKAGARFSVSPEEAMIIR